MNEEEAQEVEDSMAESPAPDYFLQSMMTPSDQTEELAKGSGRAGKEQKYSDSFKVKYKTEMCKNWQ